MAVTPCPLVGGCLDRQQAGGSNCRGRLLLTRVGPGRGRYDPLAGEVEVDPGRAAITVAQSWPAIVVTYGVVAALTPETSSSRDSGRGAVVAGQ
jgi:hypothetical protein